MPLKKLVFSLLLICGFAPTVQAANIVQAIENNDIEAMKAAFNQNPDSFFEPFLDPTALEMITPIHKAAMTANNPNILELLLLNGVNINTRSDSGKTPLYYALKYNPHTEVAFYLINRGSDTNARDNLRNHVFLAVNNPIVFRSNMDRINVFTAMNRHGLNLSDLFLVNNTANIPTAKRINVPAAKTRQNVLPLTDEDFCGVCLTTIKELAESNTTTYKTNCCKNFLCKKCTDSMVASGRSISCPFCRRQPLNVNPLQVTINPETQEVTAEKMSQILTIR